MSKSFDNTSYVIIFSLKRKSIKILYTYICPFNWEYGKKQSLLKSFKSYFQSLSMNSKFTNFQNYALGYFKAK